MNIFHQGVLSVINVVNFQNFTIMLSVDGKKSYLASSDEILEHVCRPCNDDGETKEARYFCEFCKDYLCFDCRNDHITFKATKSHSVVAVQVTKGTGTTVTQNAIAILCACDQKRAVEVYCEKHDEVICPSCKTTNHRSCNTCPIKYKVSRNTKKEFKELMDKAKSLQAEAEGCKKDGEENNKQLEGSKEEHKKEILAYRRKLDQILDGMETVSLEELDTKTNQQLEKTKQYVATLTTSQQKLKTDIHIIENVNITNDTEIMFAAIVKLSKSIPAYDELIQDVRQNIQQPKLEFHKHDILLEVLKSFKGLGRIETPETGSVQQDRGEILDMKVKSSKEFNIKLADEVETPDIIGCTFLSHNRILLCDSTNSKLKLLDSDMAIKKSLKLSERPYNVAAVSGNEAVITYYYSNDLQYIGTRSNLKLGKRITLPVKLPVKCRGLCVVNDVIYTVYHKDSGHDEIWRLDRAGNILSKTLVTQTSSGHSDYLGFCLSGSNSRLYLTDWRNSIVTCFQLDGKMAYQYQDQGLIRPNGIYVDTAGNSLVRGTLSHNVVVITAGGRKCGELLISKDIRKPRCVDYRPEDQTLIVGCENSSKIFVHKLGV